jgi:O-antigen ligase
MIPGIGTVARAIGILLIPCAVLAMTARGWVRALVPAHVLSLMFLAWAALSVLWAPSQDAAEVRFFTELQCVLVFILLWQFACGAQQTKRYIQAYVLGTFVASGSTILHFLDHQTTAWQRYSAAGSDPNDLSLMLALTIPVSYSFFLRDKGSRALLWLMQIATALLACLLTASRTGAIVSGLALVIVVLTLNNLNLKQITVFSVVGFASVAALVVFVPASTWERLLTIQKEVSTGTLNERTAVWSAGLQAFSTHPITGVGVGAFADATRPLLAYMQGGDRYVAHNTFISVLTELGLVGLILFVGILSCSAAPLFHLPSTERKVWLLTCLVWLVGVCTLSWEHMKPTWVLLAFLLQVDATAKRVCYARDPYSSALQATQASYPQTTRVLVKGTR